MSYNFVVVLVNWNAFLITTFTLVPEVNITDTYTAVFTNLDSHGEVHEVEVHVVQLQIAERLLAGFPHQRGKVERAP